jgi:putative two-component system response regulator
VIGEGIILEARILIVDDQEPNVSLLERLLEVSGFTNVDSTTDSSKAVELCAELDPDLLLLDLQMPPPDGFEVMGQLEPWIRSPVRLPILVLTADTTPETKRRALALGASDFLSKPLDMAEVTLRIKNLVQTRMLQLELREQNKLLEQRVRERTRDLEEARIEALDRLALAADYRDDATGAHARRIGELAALLAAALELPGDQVELIRRAAPLHDLGKLGISDSILLKKGQFTEEEFEAMKLHVTIGAEILGRSRSPLLRMAEEIALTHHERWDGGGYPAGLRGEGIPLTGRIVAVADVFDAITHRRSSRPTAKDAVAEIESLAGLQFDPRVVAALGTLDSDVLRRAADELDLVA